VVEIIILYQAGNLTDAQALDMIAKAPDGDESKAEARRILDLDHYLITAARKSAGARLPWEGW
jgi:hypothetical protein